MRESKKLNPELPISRWWANLVSAHSGTTEWHRTLELDWSEWLFGKWQSISPTMINLQEIAFHYEKHWGTESEQVQWKSGPILQLAQGFHVLVFPPSAKRNMWTYATWGMSGQPDSNPIELHLFSPLRSDDHVELLTAIAHYHTTGEYLDVGHTVNFGRPWLPGSKCGHGLISIPYLDGPQVEWLCAPQKKVHFLWLIPITPEELEFQKKYGLEALERHFEDSNFDYANPFRKSAINLIQ